jgi:DMSO/TMAO reductase YedYZ molybdopterin-dependent catalytic subunit
MITADGPARPRAPVLGHPRKQFATSTPLSRRSFLQAALAAPAALLQRSATFISTIPLGDPGVRGTPPFGRLLGSGLDARLFTDLSALSPEKPDTLVTPADHFYVRTAAPSNLRPSDPANLRPSSRPGTEVDGTSFARIDRSTGRVRVGPYVMECAGNSDPTNFGLISAATWSGLPMPVVLDRIGANRSRPLVLVEGVDPPGPSATSVPGASWIFARDQLDGAILADEMNGAPLPRDHGGPAVRLIVPGWYGCACIKWVNRIDPVADDEPVTVQMREFAARTHQPFDSREIATGLRAGSALLARDFAPAVIDTAAMPVRVEKWADAGRIFYRVVGILWGGSKPTNALTIRFRSGDVWTRVDDCPLPASTLMWSMWSHTWRPPAPGRYQIVLRVDDPSIRTRRLDLFFYVREVQVDEI